MRTDATWGPRVLAVGLVAIGGVWLGTGIANAQSDPSSPRSPAASVQRYDETVARAEPSSPPTGVTTTTIEELQIGLGGGIILLAGAGGILLVRARPTRAAA